MTASTTTKSTGRPGERSRIIAANPAALYQYIADVTRMPEWQAGVVRADWIGDVTAARAGARFRAHYRSGPVRRARHYEIVVAEPGRAFAFRGPAVSSFRLEPVAAGTRLTYTGELADLDRSLERIAALAERRVVVPQPRLGQACTADGPLDLSAMYVMHHAFRRDLRDFALAVPATPVGDAQVWAALARRWHGFATSLHHHHRVEDIWIWPALLRRAGAEGRQVLQAMEDEHTALDPLVQACAGGFRAMTAAPDAATRDRLGADVGRIRTVLGDHLAHEETSALPLAQQYLPVAAWKDSELAARKEFGLTDLGFTVPWSTLELPADQFDIAFAHGGTFVRVVLALTRRRFIRGHRLAFRHLPSR
jgi:hemerythrin HHE cation binding domain-containing protein/polyketide cyclase/dehydrase/lipid transport protein